MLIVVDMQYQFYASRNRRVQAACEELIHQAGLSGEPILFLEFNTYGKTMRKLAEAAKDYNPGFALKSYDDGSQEVVSYLEKEDLLGEKEIRVCGVNTDYCVKSTAVGLKKKLPRVTITVVEKACHSWLGNYNAQEELPK